MEEEERRSENGRRSSSRDEGKRRRERSRERSSSSRSRRSKRSRHEDDHRSDDRRHRYLRDARPPPARRRSSHEDEYYHDNEHHGDRRERQDHRHRGHHHHYHAHEGDSGGGAHWGRSYRRRRAFRKQRRYYQEEDYPPPQRQRRQINKAVRGFKFYERTPNFVLQRYRAAGILPYATHDNRIFLLLGEEDRSSKGEKDKVWLNFGGKKEDEQDKGQPEATALREFAEETAGLFHPQMEALRMALQTNFADTLRMWNEKSRYVLYVVPMPYDPQVGDAFRRRREEEKESFRDTDHLRLQWVDAALLFAAKTEEGEDKEKVKETEEAARVVEELEETVYVEIDGERCKVHSFFMLLLRMPEVKRFLLETLPKRGIASSSSATEQQQQQSEGGEEEEEEEKEDEQEQRPEQEQGQEPQQVHKKSRNRSKTRRRPKHKHSKSTDQPPPTRSTPIDQ